MALVCVRGVRECDGCSACDGESDRVCPVCGKECELIYKSADGDIVGCDNCIRIEFAEDALDAT